jgi:hypothetical protein
MSEWFGGVTMDPAAGCYQPEDAAIHCDPDIVFESSTIKDQPQHSPAENTKLLDQLASRIGRELGQDQVFEAVLTEDTAQWQPGHQRQFLTEPSVRSTAAPISPEDVFCLVMPLND